jgi:hypothetical protein
VAVVTMGSCISSQQAKALIVWDIENMQPPSCVNDFFQLIKTRFLDKHTTYEIVGSVSRAFLKYYADKKIEDQLIASGVKILLASSFSKKRDADFILNRCMLDFVYEMPRNSATKIILITSDSDFILAITMALKVGIDVQLIYNHEKVSQHLLSLPYKSAPVKWVDLGLEVQNPKTYENKCIQTCLQPLPSIEFEYEQTLPSCKWVYHSINTPMS